MIFLQYSYRFTFFFCFVALVAEDLFLGILEYSIEIMLNLK